MLACSRFSDSGGGWTRLNEQKKKKWAGTRGSLSQAPFIFVPHLLSEGLEQASDMLALSIKHYTGIVQVMGFDIAQTSFLL